MKVLFCGDVVGRSGREAVLKHVPKLRQDLGLDFVVVNGENAAAGFGITAKICAELHDGGVTDIVLAPIGFLSDHMEVVYDLDTEAAQLCRELGVNLSRASTVGVHPAFVSMLREMVAERVHGDGPSDECRPECCALPARPRP